MTSEVAFEYKTFNDEDDVKVWLLSRGVAQPKAVAAAPILWAQGFDTSATLLDVSVASLKEIGLSTPTAMELHNMLKREQQQQQQQQRKAYNVSFTVLRDNRQADGLRKQITIAAANNAATYPPPTSNSKAEDLHKAAFKSESIPAGFDLSDDGAPRLLSVHLHFLSLDTVYRFEGQVVELLQNRPHLEIVNTRTMALSRNFENLCNATAIAWPSGVPPPVHAYHYTPRQS
jgi:hypothetical protein